MWPAFAPGASVLWRVLSAGYAFPAAAPVIPPPVGSLSFRRPDSEVAGLTTRSSERRGSVRREFLAFSPAVAELGSVRRLRLAYHLLLRCPWRTLFEVKSVPVPCCRWRAGADLAPAHVGSRLGRSVGSSSLSGQPVAPFVHPRRQRPHSPAGVEACSSGHPEALCRRAA